ncbi:MAG: response regulator transcription factor [Acutalibacteraceae bacterium]
MNIFLLEDDEAIGIGLTYSLEKEGYSVTLAKTVSDGIKIISKNNFALYILDLTLPDGNGYDVCKKIKEKGDLPVIFLTAYDDEVNVVMGFELGADDYIAKPFRVKELLVRIKSVLRRYNKDSADGIVKINSLTINTNEAKVYKGDDEVVLTAMEYRLLLILLNNRGTVLSRNQLLENIWDVDGDFVEDNTLTVYIKRLRDKIEENPANPEYIKTVRGLGYVIENDK